MTAGRETYGVAGCLSTQRRGPLARKSGRRDDRRHSLVQLQVLIRIVLLLEAKEVTVAKGLAEVLFLRMFLRMFFSMP